MPVPSKTVTVATSTAIAAGAQDVTVPVVDASQMAVGDYLMSPEGNLLYIDNLPGGNNIRVDHLAGSAIFATAGEVWQTSAGMKPSDEVQTGVDRMLVYEGVLLGTVTPGAGGATRYSQPIPCLGAAGLWFVTYAASNPGTGSKLLYRGWVKGSTVPKTWDGTSGSLLSDLLLTEIPGGTNWAVEGGGVVHTILGKDLTGVLPNAGGLRRLGLLDFIQVAAYTAAAVAVTRLDVFVQF